MDRGGPDLELSSPKLSLSLRISVGEPLDFTPDGWFLQIAMYDVVPINPVRCNNGTKDDALTTLNIIDVGFAGTAPQLDTISPNRADDGKRDVYYQTSCLECRPTSKYKMRVFLWFVFIFDGHNVSDSGDSRGSYPSINLNLNFV